MSQPVKIILARHGEDEDNSNGILNGHRDLPLTAVGEVQAALLAETLRFEQIEAIFCSPLQRALKTAEIIAAHHQIEALEVDARLRERDFGILTGKPITSISKFAKKIVEAHGIQYFLEGEKVESFPAVLRRVSSFLGEVQQKHAHKTLLVVSHGHTSKMLYAAYHSLNWREGLQITPLGNAEYIMLQA